MSTGETEGGIGEMIAKVLVLFLGIIAFLGFLQLPNIVRDYFPDGTFKNVLTELLHEDGMLVVATVLFSAGVGYIFFRGEIARFISSRSDVFTNRVVGSIDQGYEKVSASMARRVGSLDCELVLRWISEGHASPEDYKRAALAAAKKYYVPERGYEDSYVEEVLKQLVNGWSDAGYWREGMSTEIYLEKVDRPELADRKLIRWEETQSFTVVCPAKAGRYKIPQEMGIEVRPEDLAKVLSLLELSLKAAPAGEAPEVLFQLSSVLRRVDVDKLKSLGQLEVKVDDKRSVNLEFQRNYLNVSIETNIDLKAAETTITARQICLMRQSDRQYCFVSAMPTKDLFFSMRLGTNLRDTVFSDVTVSAESYHRKAASNVKNTKDELDSFIRHVDGWFLPGSVIVVEWTDA